MEDFPGKIRTSKRDKRKYTLSRRQREWLVRWFPITDNKTLMQAMGGISPNTLNTFAKELRLYKVNKNLPPFPGTLTRRPDGYKQIVLTTEQEEWLKRWYPVTENPGLMKASGMTHATLHRYARKFHLAKSRKGLKGIKHRQAAHIRRVCEHSGYYDSLRGKPPSEAAQAGTAQMWREIREGKREHPIRAMARKQPERYKMLMERKSKNRKETIRMERTRLRWGLPRKTNISIVVMQRYTPSQLNHRYNAKRRGYILADTCGEGSGHRFVIYYNDTTRRSPIFERHCEKDGFRIREWEN